MPVGACLRGRLERSHAVLPCHVASLLALLLALYPTAFGHAAERAACASISSTIALGRLDSTASLKSCAPAEGEQEEVPFLQLRRSILLPSDVMATSADGVGCAGAANDGMREGPCPGFVHNTPAGTSAKQGRVQEVMTSTTSSEDLPVAIGKRDWDASVEALAGRDTVLEAAWLASVFGAQGQGQWLIGLMLFGMAAMCAIAWCVLDFVTEHECFWLGQEAWDFLAKLFGGVRRLGCSACCTSRGDAHVLPSPPPCWALGEVAKCLPARDICKLSYVASALRSLPDELCSEDLLLEEILRLGLEEEWLLAPTVEKDGGLGQGSPVGGMRCAALRAFLKAESRRKADEVLLSASECRSDVLRFLLLGICWFCFLCEVMRLARSEQQHTVFMIAQAFISPFLFLYVLEAMRDDLVWRSVLATLIALFFLSDCFRVSY